MNSNSGQTGKKNGQQDSEFLGPLAFSSLDMLKDVKISSRFEDNEKYLKKIFTDCSDIVVRPFELGQGVKAAAVCVDGLVNSQLVHKALEDIMVFSKDEVPTIQKLKDMELPITQIKLVDNFSDFLDGVMSGDTGLLLDGDNQAIMMEIRGPSTRSVGEPKIEQVVRGPKEGFVENIRVNTSLIRRRVKTPMMKMKAFKLGRRSRTNVALVYIEGITDPALVEEVVARLDKIDVDIVMETGIIEEYIQDSAYSPFPQAQVSERPDTVAGALMQGRVAIVVDGSPMVLLLPAVFSNFLMSPEDQYERFQIMTFLRWIRYLFLLLSLFTPALYVALITFHQEMVPTSLLFTIAGAREEIPFPAVVEVLLMEIIFEALREAGVRLPQQVGSAFSILGAIVIGQAAVQAGIVSAPVVMVVSITGIASFTIPKYSGAIAIRLLRFPLIILASMFGIYGILLGSMVLLGHMASLRSLGVPYLAPLAPRTADDWLGALLRLPHWMRIERANYYNPQDRIRRNPGVAQEIMARDGMRSGQEMGHPNQENEGGGS